MRLPLAICAFLAAAPVSLAQTSWQLVWSDEFTGSANALPDASKWTYDLGAGGWGNNELETYTNSGDNARLDGKGNLLIPVLTVVPGQDPSARLKTQGKFTTTYGKIEARIKLPFGQGIWPAFWMLGADIETVGWPACGEVDIMENIGREPSINHGSMHGPGYSGGDSVTGAYTLPNGEKYSDDFHTFAIVWSADSMEFFVDSISYKKATPASLPAGAPWAFKKPFFLLLNVAVGGSWPGNPDASTKFPQTMTVDYVRVYEAAKAPAIIANGVVNAASFGSVMAPGSLATIFGTSLADAISTDLFDKSRGAFRQSAGGTAVSVNGVPSALTYVSPGQINFQIPWEAPVGKSVPVEVTRDGIASNLASVILSETAPSAFSANGAAALTCIGAAGAEAKPCTLWGNGFGPTKLLQHDGVPSGYNPLPQTTNSCKLTVGGVNATVTYCGAAPALIIDQLNFNYPAGLPGSDSTIAATLTIGNTTGDLQLPRHP